MKTKYILGTCLLFGILGTGVGVAAAEGPVLGLCRGTVALQTTESPTQTRCFSPAELPSLAMELKGLRLVDGGRQMVGHYRSRAGWQRLRGRRSGQGYRFKLRFSDAAFRYYYTLFLRKPETASVIAVELSGCTSSAAGAQCCYHFSGSLPCDP